MILVDTSVRVDHLRVGDKDLSTLLNAASILTHPYVIGEIALEHLRNCTTILNALTDLPHAVVANDPEVLGFIDAHKLFGLGIGYIDVHLLASIQLTPGAQLWTRDKRLFAAARKMGLPLR